MFSVLLIESDVKVLNELTSVLEKQNCFFKQCTTLTSAYVAMEQRHFDVVVSEHQPSDGDALELLEYLEHFAFQTRSMILAKGTSYKDRIEAYKKGVDDFLLKPVNLSEFWYRLHTLCHRQKIFSREALTLCDGVAIYPRESLLQVKTEQTYLPKKENQILTCLLRHRSRVVGRDELVRWVWQGSDNPPKDITLDVYIKRIRLKLGEYSQKLQTIRGFGYRIAE